MKVKDVVKEWEKLGESIHSVYQTLPIVRVSPALFLAAPQN